MAVAPLAVSAPAGASDRRWAAARRGAGLAAVGSVAVASANEALHGGSGVSESGGPEVVLVSLALLCIVGLTERRAPSIAWICATVAAGLAAIDLVGVDRSRVLVDASADLILATVLRVVPVLTAAGYLVSRPAGDWRRLVRAVAGVGVLASGAVLLAALGEGWRLPQPFDAAWSRAASRILLVDVAAGIGLGAWLDVLPAWRRAAERWRRAAIPLPWSDRLRILLDELAPMATIGRRAAVEAERTRLAAALHATVMPTLRTALEASHAGSMEAAQRGLGDAVSEVEQLMASREPVIVDALGMLPGLEWLAERIQLRAGIAVEIDVETAPARPPNAVERAAFRVAQLALDNTARHSAATAVRIAGSIGADHVELTVEDDGVGLPPGSTGGGRHGPGRGLRDMAAAGDSVRARVVVGAASSLASAGRPGTTVRFSWPSG